MTGRQVNGKGKKKKENEQHFLQDVKDWSDQKIYTYISYFHAKDTPSPTHPSGGKSTQKNRLLHKVQSREQTVKFH